MEELFYITLILAILCEVLLFASKKKPSNVIHLSWQGKEHAAKG